jgi:hypothetical protein
LTGYGRIACSAQALHLYKHIRNEQPYKEEQKVKKVYLVIMTLVIAMAVVAGCSKGYESTKTVGDVGITLKAERYPLAKGDNALSAKVVDKAGNAISDATVQARYYMPAMPGMAAMEFTSQASLNGSAYAFGANIPMEGGWKVDISVTQPGKPAVSATFNVDAR